MADSKISALGALAATPHVDDELVVVDKSDTSQAASGTTKRLTARRLLVPQRIPATPIVYDNFDRAAPGTSNTLTIASGTLRMMGLWLPEGFSIANLHALSGGTALTRGTGSHLWAALFDSSLAFLRQSTDDTSGAWGANTLRQFALSSAFVTTYTGLHYIGLLVVAGSGGTMPTLSGPVTTNEIVAASAPSLGGNSTTGLTATAPNPAGAVGNSPRAYCGVS